METGHLYLQNTFSAQALTFNYSPSMLRIFFVLLLLLHGLIRLMGFVKAFGLASVAQLSGQISRPAGVLWLAAALLFVASALLFLLKKEGWWMAGAAALLLSQVLIFSQWRDAKFGSIANLIVLIGVVISFGRWQFNGMVRSELEVFYPVRTPEKKVIDTKMVATLPEPVQKWLLRSGCIGKEIPQRVHLLQKGEMRTEPDGAWMPVQAEQYFRVDEPGFLWIAKVQAAPFVQLDGRDKYMDGRGHMLIRLLSLFPVADAKGPATDQGTMLRFLAETCWFPGAALNDYIRWEPVDSVSAMAVMHYGGVEASGVFRFSPEGDLLAFDAMRYYDRKGGATLEKWHIANMQDSYRSFDGVRVPTRSEVSWLLEAGDFVWFKLEVSDIQYDEKLSL